MPHDELGRINIDITNTSAGLPFHYYDMPISNEGIESMEITTGPKISDNDKYIIELVREKLGYKFKIKKYLFYANYLYEA